MLAVAAAAGLGQGNVGEVRPMIGFIVEAAGSSQLAVCRVKLRSAHAGSLAGARLLVIFAGGVVVVKGAVGSR